MPSLYESFQALRLLPRQPAVYEANPLPVPVTTTTGTTGWQPLRWDASMRAAWAQQEEQRRTFEARAQAAARAAQFIAMTCAFEEHHRVSLAVSAAAQYIRRTTPEAVITRPAPITGEPVIARVGRKVYRFVDARYEQHRRPCAGCCVYIHRHGMPWDKRARKSGVCLRLCRPGSSGPGGRSGYWVRVYPAKGDTVCPTAPTTR